MSLRTKTFVPISIDGPMETQTAVACISPIDIAQMRPNHCWITMGDTHFLCNAEDLARALLRAVGKEELLK